MSLRRDMEVQGNVLFQYRSYLPLILLGGAIVMFYIEHSNEMVQALVLSRGQGLFLGALLICLFGLAIRILTVGYTPENTSGRNTHGQKADTVNQTGMYSMVRHPLYVGNYFMWLGVAVLTRNPWFILLFTLVYWLYYERIMFAEEQYLIKKFGEQYTRWSRKTPAFLPSFSTYRHPKCKFNWKKVLSREKNGILAVFSVLLFFDVLRYYLIHGQLGVVHTWIWIGALISIAYYLAIKVLSKTTNVLAA